MKKVKIMLMSLLVLAVLGGTLAFKAKFSSNFCSAPSVSGGCAIGCPNFLNNNASATVVNGIYCFTTPRAGAAAGKECKTADGAGAANLACQATTVGFILD